jgi:hypothetical protein
MAAIDRHRAIIWNNPTHNCIQYHNVTATNLHTHCRWKVSCPSPPDPVAPLPAIPPVSGTAPAPLAVSDGSESYQIEGMLCSCVHIDSPHPNTQLVNHTEYTKASNRDIVCIPDLLSTLSVTWKFH